MPAGKLNSEQDRGEDEPRSVASSPTSFPTSPLPLSPSPVRRHPPLPGPQDQRQPRPGPLRHVRIGEPDDHETVERERHGAREARRGPQRERAEEEEGADAREREMEQ